MPVWPGNSEIGEFLEGISTTHDSKTEIPPIAIPPAKEIVLRARKGWQPIDLQELWRGRELFGYLVWRDISIRYKQTLLGGLWAILQPLLAMLIFTVFFNRLAGIQGDGVPYPLFAY